MYENTVRKVGAAFTHNWSQKWQLWRTLWRCFTTVLNFFSTISLMYTNSPEHTGNQAVLEKVGFSGRINTEGDQSGSPNQQNYFDSFIVDIIPNYWIGATTIRRITPARTALLQRQMMSPHVRSWYGEIYWIGQQISSTSDIFPRFNPQWIFLLSKFLKLAQRFRTMKSSLKQTHILWTWKNLGGWVLRIRI